MNVLTHLRQKSPVRAFLSSTIKLTVLITLLVIGGAKTRVVTDAWAGATVVQTPAKIAPSVRFTNASPALLKNTIHVVEGQTVSLCVGANSSRNIAQLGLLMGSFPDPANMTFVTTSCDSGSLVSKSLTWPTAVGDAARYPDGVTVTLTARDYSYAVPANRVRTLRILLEDSTQPVLDALATQQTLTVGTPLDLPILATGDAVDHDPVTLFTFANGLPANARLGPTTQIKSGPNTGKWMARFKWTPSKANYAKSHQYVVSFLAKDENPSLQGVDAPDQVDVTFTLQPPEITDDSIKSFAVGKAIWNPSASALAMAGQIRFTHPYAMVSGLGVVLSTTNQASLTDAPIPVQDNGRWLATLNINSAPASVPCQITARLVHIDATNTVLDASVPAITKAIKGVPANCSP